MKIRSAVWRYSWHLWLNVLGKSTEMP